MAYCIMKLSKIKSFTGSGSMGDRYRHNMRIYEVDNAEHTKTELNRELIEGQRLSYEEAFRENIRLYEEAGIETNIRKNAILAFEVMLTFSKEAKDIDIDNWCQANLDWLDKTFNKDVELADGTKYSPNNVVSAVLHMDETTPHIHAIVIPRDEYGKLNGSRYVESPMVMRQMQGDYADHMKEFDLERGLEYSVAKETQIKGFYAALDKIYAEELPMPLEHETIDMYRERANEMYIESRLQAHDTSMKLQRHIDEEKTKNIQNEKAKLALDKLENELSDDYLDPYGAIFTDVKEHELLKRPVHDNPKNEKLQDAYSICQEAIERQRKLELLRDAILYEQEHEEYDPYQ